MTTRICIIDDDEIYHYTVDKLITSIYSDIEIIPYTDAEEAIQSIKEGAKTGKTMPEIIFLDINMPYMNGWDFLEEYKELDGKFKKEIDLYMVSSSIARVDIKKSETYEDVKGFIHKPLTVEVLEKVLGTKHLH